MTKTGESEYRHSIVNRFLDMFERSVIIQAMITLSLIVTLCYLFLTKQPVPELLTQITLLVIGYYFGQKQVNEVRTSAQAMVRAAAEGAVKKE